MTVSYVDTGITYGTDAVSYGGDNALETPPSRSATPYVSLPLARSFFQRRLLTVPDDPLATPPVRRSVAPYGWSSLGKQYLQRKPLADVSTVIPDDALTTPAARVGVTPYLSYLLSKAFYQRLALIDASVAAPDDALTTPAGRSTAPYAATPPTKLYAQRLPLSTVDTADDALLTPAARPSTAPYQAAGNRAYYQRLSLLDTSTATPDDALATPPIRRGAAPYVAYGTPKPFYQRLPLADASTVADNVLTTPRVVRSIAPFLRPLSGAYTAQLRILADTASTGTGVTVNPTPVGMTWSTTTPAVNATYAYSDAVLTYGAAASYLGDPAGATVAPTPAGMLLSATLLSGWGYSDPALTYGGPASYAGGFGALSIPTPAGLTWSLSSPVVAGGASVNPAITGTTWSTTVPTVVGAVGVTPNPASMVWRITNPQVAYSRNYALEKPWTNPLRNSLTGEDAVPINQIFDDLEKFLMAPVFPGGILVGNGSTPGVTGGRVPPSAVRPIAADITPPGAPTGLSVTGGIQSLVLKWNANSESDLAGYYAQVDTSSAFTNPIERSAGGNVSLISGMTFGVTYYARVRAFDLSGNLSGWSSTQTGTPSQITGPDIAANTITTNMILAGAIITDRLAANAVTAGKIEAITITAAGIKVGATISGTISADSISANMIQAASITADKIAANVIDATKITVGGITTATIADLAILESKIGSLAISNRTIASNAIDARTIQADSITAREIASYSITSEELTSLNIRVGQTIQSSNYVANSTGWLIDGSGNAEFESVVLRGAFYAGTASSAYVAIAAGDQDTIRFYTGGGDYAAINAVNDRLQLVSPYGQGGNAYVELFSSNAQSGLSMVYLNASTILAEGNVIARGSFSTLNNITVGQNADLGLVRSYTGGGAKLRMTSGNTIEFFWNGTQVEAYIDGAGPYKFKSV